MKNSTIDAMSGDNGKGLDTEYSPAVLAGLFEMSPSNIYQLQQRGIIPHACSYRKAIQTYLQYWKTKATTQSGSLTEISMIRKAELDRARAVLVWYTVRKERKELVDLEEFVERAQPIFSGLRTELIALTRKFPELRSDITSILNGIASKGVNSLSRNEKKLDKLIAKEIAEMDALEEDAAERASRHPDEEEGSEWEELSGQELLDNL